MAVHRLRLKDEEIAELEYALLKHIRDLVEKRRGKRGKFEMLSRLWYRLIRSRTHRTRGGCPGEYAGPTIVEDKDRMFKLIRNWVEEKIRAVEEPEEYERERAFQSAMIKAELGKSEPQEGSNNV